MDALKYQVFLCQNFPRHVLLHYYALSNNKNNFSHVRDHDNSNDNNITTDLNDNYHLCYL